MWSVSTWGGARRRLALPGPPARLELLRLWPAMDVDAGRPPLPAHVDGHDDALTAERGRTLRDERGPSRGFGVEHDLVGAESEQRAHFLGGVDPAADRHRHEALSGEAIHHVVELAPVILRAAHVEDDDLVYRPLVQEVHRGERLPVDDVRVGEVDASHHR